MPRERSLLERLAEPESDAGRTIHENTGQLTDSVLRNLRRLLNSHHGITPIGDDYGIPDLSDALHSFPETNSKMRNSIREAIEKYEPRLSQVRVKLNESPDDPLALHFEITAQLITADERKHIWFETRVDPTGQVQVRS